VRVGGNIAAPKKLNDVPPVYPQTALQARIQGIVIIEATIGSNGTVRNTRVLRSVPMLDEAALDAVRQWEYAPTLLNGVAMPVIMTVTVNFSLK
jgi:protein TonB